ncbi:hypothetical protein AOLI_G00064570 [Acnodon oligacanthus]
MRWVSVASLWREGVSIPRNKSCFHLNKASKDNRLGYLGDQEDFFAMATVRRDTAIPDRPPLQVRHSHLAWPGLAPSAAHWTFLSKLSRTIRLTVDRFPIGKAAPTGLTFMLMTGIARRGGGKQRWATRKRESLHQAASQGQ